MDYEKINLEQHISGDEFEYVDLTEDATAQPCQAKDDLKSVRVKNGSKNNLKGSRGKGKAHKKWCNRRKYVSCGPQWLEMVYVVNTVFPEKKFENTIDS